MGIFYVVLGDEHGAHALEVPTWYGVGATAEEAVEDAQGCGVKLPTNWSVFRCETDLDLESLGDGDVFFEPGDRGVVSATLRSEG